MGRSKGAMLVIVVIAAVVIFVVAVGINTWRGRVNPSMVNEGPSTGQMRARPPA